MASLRFNLYGYVYQSGLDVLRRSYTVAAGAHAAEAARIRTNLDAYHRDGVWIGERDEDGTIIWDQEQILEFDIQAAEEAMLILRKTYVVAAYHHWEKCAQTWVGLKARGGHADLAKRARRANVPQSPDLERVYRLANTLKHSNDRTGLKLLEAWPEMLPERDQWTPRGAQWFDAVHLEDADVTTIFDVVAASGPTPTWDEGEAEPGPHSPRPG